MSHPSQIPGPRDPQGQQPPPWFDPSQGYQQAPPPGYRYEPGYPPYVPQESKSNGLAISSLILGIVGLSLAWIPIVNYIAMVLGLIALVLGGIGIFKSHRIMSIAGAVLGLVAIVASFAVIASFANAMNEAAEDYNAAVAEAPAAPSLTTP